MKGYWIPRIVDLYGYGRIEFGPMKAGPPPAYDDCMAWEASSVQGNPTIIAKADRRVSLLRWFDTGTIHYEERRQLAANLNNLLAYYVYSPEWSIGLYLARWMRRLYIVAVDEALPCSV